MKQPDLQLKNISIDYGNIQNIRLNTPRTLNQLHSFLSTFIQQSMQLHHLKAIHVYLLPTRAHSYSLPAFKYLKYYDPNLLVKFKGIRNGQRYKFSLKQSFSLEGSVLVKGKLVYNNLFNFFNKFKLGYEKSIYNQDKNQFSASLVMPCIKKPSDSFHLDFNSGSKQLASNFRQSILGLTVGKHSAENQMEIEMAYRVPQVNILNDLLEQKYFRPSRKISFRFQHLLKNTLTKTKSNTYQGQILKLNSQVAIPKISQSQFFKFEINYNKHINLMNYLPTTANFKKTDLQFHVNCHYLSNSNSIHQCLPHLFIRGYQYKYQLNQAIFSSKAAMKLNFYDFPKLSQFGLHWFIFGQVGFQYLNKKKVMGSLGHGLFLQIGPNVRLQLVNTLFRKECEGFRGCNWQIRISFND